MSDYNFKLVIRNERILRAIRDLGYKSVRAWCRSVGLDDNRVNGLICFRDKILNKQGRLTVNAVTLCEALGKLPEDLWTYKQMGLQMGKCTFETVVPENQLEQMSGEKLVTRLMDEAKLSKREKEIIRFRFYDGMLLSDLAEWYDVCRGRVLQIEHQAVRKLRDCAEKREDRIKQYGSISP